MEGLAANSCCLLSSPAPSQGSPRPPRGLQFSGPEMQAGGGEEEQPEREGVSVCLAETTQGCGGRPGISQAGHPADVQTWVSDPRATPPAIAWSWKSSGRLCLGAHTGGEVGGTVRDLPIALSRGFSRFCFGTTKPFLGMIFFFFKF